jgi:PilZ domain-containing protein
VSDPATLARTARESLSRGLNALQGDPHVPPHLAELAAPIAQAMGALHQVERSGGSVLAPHAQNALTNVQGALAQLQAQPPSHPAVQAAMEAVAGALGSVHQLARMQAAPQPQAAPQRSAVPQPAPQPGVAFAPTQAAFGPPPGQPQYAPAAPQYAPAPPQPPLAAPPQPPFPMQAPMQAPPQNFANPAASRPQAPPAQGPAPMGDMPVVPAELGAHSPSNFYKGLSGNDIIDHGGLFVSTYKLPKLGAPVRLKVSLPGGYEFEANAVVRWRREPSDAGSDAPPGFGAQFTQITPEARQLVYRYVRNREPMFHDDL